ncbi:MAG: ABC transporter permease [Chitinispirillaceae bacterium]|nr:ABC transporter permease [Chitinispirillaceae bacterium]
MTGLMFKELRHNPAGVFGAIVAIALPVALVILALVFFGAYDHATALEFASRETAIEQQMKDLHEAYRKITLELGFNILILPKEQNLGDFYADDFAVRDMPFEYARRLSNSKIVIVNHLLPALFRKIEWKEHGRTVLLTGIKGEIPLLHRSNSHKPMMEIVEPGHIVIGYEHCRELSLQKGDTIMFNREPFVIASCNDQRGTVDDITVWIDLDQAQEMLGMQGRISAMFALECRCHGMEDRVSLAQIRSEIESVLPETQVVEFMSEALSRAEARWKVVTLEKEKILRNKTLRDSFIAERKRIAIPVIVFLFAAGVLFCGWLIFKNLEERRGEIALLTAIGVNRSQITNLFLGRTAVVLSAGFLLGIVPGGTSVLIARSLFGVSPAITVSNAGILISTVTLLILLFVILSLLIRRTVSGDPATSLMTM